MANHKRLADLYDDPAIAQMKSKLDLGFVHGLRTVPRAVELLREMPNVLRLLLIPLVLTALLDAAAFYTSYGWLRDWIVQAVPGDGLWGMLRSVLSVVAAGVVVFALAWTFSLVYLTLCELVVDRVSESVEERLTGQVVSVTALSGQLRGILRSLGQAAIIGGLGVLLLLVSVIPLIGPIVAVLTSVAALGYSFFSVCAGRKSLSLSARFSLARTHLAAVMGLGVPIFLANLIPLANLLLLPVFVVAGTLLFLDVERQQPVA